MPSYVPPHLRKAAQASSTATAVSNSKRPAAPLNAASALNEAPNDHTSTSEDPPVFAGRQKNPWASSHPQRAKNKPKSKAKGQSQSENENKNKNKKKNKKKGGSWKNKDNHPFKWPKIPKHPKKGEKPERYDESWEAAGYPSRDEGVPINSFEEENSEPALVDWEGNWLPPPCDWETRRSFHDTNFWQRMDIWRKGVEVYYPKAGPYMDISNLTVFLGAWDLPALRDRPREGSFAPPTGEIAPRVWLPLEIDGELPRNFWHRLISSPPMMLEEDDLIGPPWWETYTGEGHDVIQPHVVPDAKVDPLEELNTNPRRLFNSREAVAFRRQCLRDISKQTRKAKEEAKLSKKKYHDDIDKDLETAVPLGNGGYLVLEKHNEPDIAPKPEVKEEVESPRIKEEDIRPLEPAVNLLLRPIQPSDIYHIHSIYNYHRSHSLFSPEEEDVSLPNLKNRVADVEAASLPWIVAVEKGEHTREIRQRAIQDKVIGFAYVDDFHSSRGMWKYTVELEIFVHRDYKQQKIGSCLLDQMLSLLDPRGYKLRGGYYWTPNNHPAFFTGAERLVRTVICNVPYVHGDTSYLNTRDRWLRKFGLRQCGDYPMSGVKGNHSVDLAVFCYETDMPRPTS